MEKPHPLTEIPTVEPIVTRVNRFAAETLLEFRNVENYLADRRDAWRMTECERHLRDARLFGKHYRRGQFERAFIGMTPLEIWEVRGADLTTGRTLPNCAATRWKE